MIPETAAASQTLMTDGTFWAATALFVVSYAVIIVDKIHKAVVALLGASLMIVLKILDQHEAFHVAELGVDWNVIFLLISMMIIVNIMKPTGVFEYMAIKGAKLAKADPLRVLLVFAAVTATLSALLDNVTTVLLIAPVTIHIAEALEINPVPYLISNTLASNIGGTATLVGDPPNIMIASKAQITFLDFINHLTPVVLIIMLVFLLIIRLLWRNKLRTRADLQARIMEMDERKAIRDPVMVRRALFVLGVVVAGFVLHGTLGFEPATIALSGAALLLLLTRTETPHQILAEVEWPTIFFFIGLFIIVGGVIKVGLIKWLSLVVLELTHGNLFATSMVVMWFSAFASAIIDNIPYVATMNPLIIDMARQLWPNLSGVELLRNPDLMPVWWSLALGACLGGNGSAIGASANVIVVGMSERIGRRISFIEFMKYGMPIMIMTVMVSTLYVWLRYYILKF